MATFNGDGFFLTSRPSTSDQPPKGVASGILFLHEDQSFGTIPASQLTAFNQLYGDGTPIRGILVADANQIVQRGRLWRGRIWCLQAKALVVQ
jgi:hypothetical protein